MSIPVLVQVYDEVRRLAIAGSSVAAGDFRLKKLIPPMEKSGEKAPVFGKVAQAIQAVVESNEKTSAVALLELTTLVNAVLYTQGETGAAGDLKPIETTDLGVQTTQAGARVLKPLLEALRSTGSGRLELVRDAFELGTFKDLRLINPSLAAIDDPYPEIGDFIVTKVLPIYGKAILPELRAKLDIKGRGGHLKRLTLINHLDPEGSRPLIQQALQDGSKEMKVAAIECLGSSDEDMVYLLDQTKSKAKDVRTAAFRALSAAGTSKPDVIAALKKAIAGADLNDIVERVKICPLPEIRHYVMDLAEEALATTFKAKEKTEQGAAIDRLQSLVACMNIRKDTQAEAFVLRVFENAGKLEKIKTVPAGSDLIDLVARELSRGTPKTQKKLVAAHAELNGRSFSSAVFAAWSILPPADFYNQFAAFLKGWDASRKKTTPAQARALSLVGVLTSGHGDSFAPYRPWLNLEVRDSEASSKQLDDRWLDAAISADVEDLVYRLARPGHAATTQYLRAKYKSSKSPGEMDLRLRTMVHIGHPDSTDAVIEVIKSRAAGAYHAYIGYWLGPMVAQLPKSALPAIEALLPSLPDKIVDQLIEFVTTLRSKPE